MAGQFEQCDTPSRSERIWIFLVASENNCSFSYTSNGADKARGCAIDVAPSLRLTGRAV